MEGNQNEGQRIFKIKASELLTRFKHKDDRYNFCRQRGKQNKYS